MPNLAIPRSHCGNPCPPPGLRLSKYRLLHGAPCRKKYLRLNQELSDTLAGVTMPDLAIPCSPNHFGNPLFAESCNGYSKGLSDREAAAAGDEESAPYCTAGGVEGAAASSSLGAVISLPCSVAARSMEAHSSSCEGTGGQRCVLGGEKGVAVMASRRSLILSSFAAWRNRACIQQPAMLCGCKIDGGTEQQLRSDRWALLCV